MEEYWDIYNEKRELQNRKIRRGEPFNDGEYYVCCEVWITNSKNQMLITKRHPDKKAGGLWEFVGGGVLVGESTLQASIREVQEEVGISLEEHELKLLNEFTYKNYFMDVYIVKKDIDISEVVIKQDEATEAKWISKEDLKEMIKNQSFVRSVANRFLNQEGIS